MKVDWKKYEEKISNFFTKYIIKIAIVAVVVVLFFYFYQFSSYDLSKDLCINTTGDDAECLSKDAARWGTFGDFFGGTLNPILSFLALIIVLKTYLSQQEELKETRKILKEQSETQKRQQFDNTFFELLKLHNQILEDFKKKDLRAVFDYVKKDSSDSSCDSVDYPSLCNAKREMEVKNYVHGHYFRSLYQLLKFIALNSDGGISQDFLHEHIANNAVGTNEKIYSNIVRALLPSDILKLLIVNCYCKENDEENYWTYKLLIERYAIFEHVSFNRSTTYDQDFAIGFNFVTAHENNNRLYDTSPLFDEARKFYKPKAFGK